MGARAAVQTQVGAAAAAHAPAAHEHLPGASARSLASAAHASSSAVSSVVATAPAAAAAPVAFARASRAHRVDPADAGAAWNFTSVPLTTLTEPETPDRTIVLQRKCSCGGPAPSDGECDECRARRLQRKGTMRAAGHAHDMPPSVSHVLRGSGDRLDRGVRDFMESRFGEDFGGVRIHTDGAAAASARDVHAQAYTVGRHVVFGAGRYAPASAAGQRLLAHELTHVVQQRHGLRAETATATATDAAETEAFVNESRVHGSAPLTTFARPAPPLARQSAGAATANVAPQTCTQDQIDTITPATDLGIEWLDRTLDLLRAFIANPRDRANADTGRALQDHFRSRDAAVAQRVLDRVRLIRIDIGRSRTGTQIRTICRPENEGLCRRGVDASMSGNTLAFCPRFFDDDLEARAGLIVHEMAHSIDVGRRGRGHITDRAYQGDRLLAGGFLSTTEALTNAESYAQFVEHLGTGKRPENNAPEDDIANECETIAPRIRAALARAQRWNRAARGKIDSAPEDMVRQHLGDDTEAIREGADAVYKDAAEKFREPIDVACHHNCGGRMAFGEPAVDRVPKGALIGLGVGAGIGAIIGGIVTGTLGGAAAGFGIGLLAGVVIGAIAGAIASRDRKIQICPGWKDLPERQRIEWMLRAAYEAFGKSAADSRRYAGLAGAIQDRFYRVPTMEEIDRDFQRTQSPIPPSTRAPAPAPATGTP